MSITLPSTLGGTAARRPLHCFVWATRTQHHTDSLLPCRFVLHSHLPAVQSTRVRRIPQPSTPPPTDSTAETDPNLIGGLLWPGTGWKSSSADSLGLDQTGLDRARDYAFAPGRNTQALLVVYQGQLVGEWYAQGFSKDSMATSWSVAKSFLSVLYGIAMDQGDLATLDEPVGQWIPEWADDARGAITLRQLLQMQSGLDSSTEDMFSAADQLAYSLDRQLDTFPTWEYANGDSMILGYLLEVITGTDFETYAQENLFNLSA